MKVTPSMNKLLRADHRTFWNRFLTDNCHLPRFIDEDGYWLVNLKHETHWGSK